MKKGKTAQPNHPSNGVMSKADREQLFRSLRQRDELDKAAAEERMGELLSDFERQLERRFAEDDAAWKEYVQIAKDAVAEANAKIDAASAERQTPRQFRPSLNLYWSSRGENAVEKRRNELRREAKVHANALYKKIMLQVKRRSVELQTQLIARTLESDEARRFLEALPKPEELMPLLNLTEIEKGLPLVRDDEGDED